MMYSDLLLTLVFVPPLRPRPLRGVFMVHKQEGCFLFVCTKFKADCSICSKVIKGSQNFEIRSHDPGHAHLWVVLWSRRSRGPSSMFVPNLKQIALFVQKLLGGPKISKFGHVT